MSDADTRGRFVWYDLMSTDPEGSKAFYTKLIGWTLTPFEGSPTPYDMWTAGAGPIGGVMQLPDEARQAGAPPHWLAYVAVPDVAATLSQAAKLGGTVLVQATDIPTVGKFGVLQDPQHAVIAVFSATGHVPGTDGPAPVGQMSWHELMTTDYEAAFKFYSTLFGWKKDEAMDMGPAGVYQMFNNGAHPLGGMFNKPPEVPVPCWLYYIRVKDVDQAAKQATSLGAKILIGPMEVPGGDRIVQAMDPQGAVFALHSTPA